VEVTVDGIPCWPVSVNPTTTAAGIDVSYYSATLTPTGQSQCEQGALQIEIDGQPSGSPVDWGDFWLGSLFGSFARPLGRSPSSPFLLVDLAAPPFLGISGQVVKAGTVMPANVVQRTGTFVEDGTTVTALVGSIVCGEVKTKALTGSNGQFAGNLFGIVVAPASVKSGCGAPGATVSFCINDLRAWQPASGPFSGQPTGDPKPVQWEAGALADVTLEATADPCVLPAIALPRTGGAPHDSSERGFAETVAIAAVACGLLLPIFIRRRIRRP
jgi:hypothetical protein